MSTKERKAFEDLQARLYQKSQESMEMHYFYEDGDSCWTTHGFSSFVPLFSVSKPHRGNWHHSNQLCDYNLGYPVGINSRNKIIGDWNQYMFFSPKCTVGLMDMTQIFHKETKHKKNKSYFYYNNDLRSKLYQFEASSFRYCVFKGNMRVIKINNKYGDSIEYIIFPFATQRNDGEKLYGLGQLNLDRNKTYHNNNNNNGRNKNKNQNKNKQKWRCDGIYTKCCLIKFFQNFSSKNINENGYFEKYILPQWDENNDDKSEAFDKNIEIEISDEFRNNLKDNLFQAAMNRRKQKKFDILIDIMHEMQVSKEEFLHKIEKSMRNAINFAKLHPETVLTQVYIDAKFARLFYEPIIYCELKDNLNNKYHKFGLPMMLVHSSKKYVIKGLLTDKMAMDNIGLFNPQSRFSNKNDLKWWNSKMEDKKQSFYHYYYKNVSAVASTAVTKDNATTRSQVEAQSLPHVADIQRIQHMQRVQQIGQIGQIGHIQQTTQMTQMARIGSINANAAPFTPSVSTVVGVNKGRKNRATRQPLALPNLATIREIDTFISKTDKLKLNRFIEIIMKSEWNKENELFTQIVSFGKLLKDLCEQFANSLLSIVAKNDILTINCENGENGNDYSEECRLQSFWNILKTVSMVRNDYIIETFGKNSVIFDILGEKALEQQKKGKSTFMELMALFEKMTENYAKALRKRSETKDMSIVTISREKGESNKNTSNGNNSSDNWQPIVKPMKGPFKPPLPHRNGMNLVNKNVSTTIF